MSSTYELATYANGAAVVAALDKAGTALQAGHVDTDSASTALHHTLGTGTNQAASGADPRITAAELAASIYLGAWS